MRRRGGNRIIIDRADDGKHHPVLSIYPFALSFSFLTCLSIKENGTLGNYSSSSSRLFGRQKSGGLENFSLPIELLYNAAQHTLIPSTPYLPIPPPDPIS
jgi:hypothetical protein